MNTALKLVLTLVVLAALGAGAFLLLRPAQSSRALERNEIAARAIEAPHAEEIEPGDALAAESPSSERNSVPKEAKTAVEPKPSAAKDEPAQIVAHIVDENLRPIVNAWLRPYDDGGQRSTGAKGPQARTGNDGIATLAWTASANYERRFAAGADGFGTVFPAGIPRAGETLHLGDLVLHAGGSVRGRVLDAEQHPVADADVVVSDDHEIWGTNDVEQLRSRGPAFWRGAPATKSASDGSFLVQGVTAGMTRAWAKSGSERWAVSEPIEVPAGGELRDVVLVLAPEAEADPQLSEIEGVVLGPDDKPVARAELHVSQKRENSSYGSSNTTDEKGRFHVKPRERGVQISIDFSDPGERFSQAHLEDVKPGTKDLVVRLEEPRKIGFAVSDEHGPVENYRVHSGREQWNITRQADVDEPHKDGRALVRTPGEGKFYFRVEAPGHMPEQLGPLDDSALPAEMLVKLRTVPGIHGRVVADEKPVPGAKLALHLQPRNSEIHVNDFTTLVQPDSETTATSADDGSFTLELQKDGEYSILVEAEGYALAQYGPVALESAKGLQELVIALDEGGVLEGKVLMPPGRSPAGVVVGVNRGDAHPRTRLVGPDGSFRFEHLSAGSWEILRAEAEFRGATSTSTSSGDDVHPGTLRRDFSIAVGQTTHKDLDLRESGACTLEIDLKNNSAPARAWTITAWPKGKNAFNGSPPSCVTDSNGHARMEASEPGEYSLTITPPAELASAFKVRADQTLQPGPNSWSQDIHTGRIEGSITGWNPEGTERWRFNTQDAPFFGDDFLAPDAAGHFSVPMIAAGTIDAMHFLTQNAQSQWDKVKSFELVPGETKTVQLP
ncbi:MAG: carboxypeptidase regulatory-like domain-containing protein [Planctomycetes bacterium]|nr:carboxypeptidase regulatory-like domain-containing protein [Planctomycetota bacterium]